MTADARLIAQLRQKLRDAEELARAATLACHQAKAMFEDALQGGFEDGFTCDVAPTEHRRDHRPGRAPKIDTNPMLQAFIEARIDKLTFAEIAADVAAHFPAEHRVGKSAIHAWWTRTQPHRS